MKVRRWLVVSAVLCSIAGTANRAQASVTDLVEQFSGVLRQLPKAPGTRGQDRERRLILNGQPLHLVTGRTADAVRPTLTFYRQRFEERSRAPKLGLRLFGLQNVDDRYGSLVLIDPESREVVREVARRERDILSAGPLRMAIVQKQGDGTDYLLLWSDTPVHADALRPSIDRDAPGQDAPSTPRPPDSVRSLNLFEPAAGYGLVRYLSESPVETALQSTKERLRQAGYQEAPGFAAAAEQLGSALIQMQRPGQSVLLRARPHKTTGSEVTYLVQAQ